MGVSEFLPCWLFGLRCPSTGALWLWVGPELGEKISVSRRAHAKEYSPELLLPVSLYLQWATAAPPSAGDPLILAQSSKSGPVSYEFLVHMRPCVCPPRLEFLFPPVLWNSCDQILLAFKTSFSGRSSSHCQTPRLESLMWGLRTFTPMREHLWYNYFTVWFYHDGRPPIVLLWPLLCFLT